MRRIRQVRALLVATGVSLLGGCTHNHYYYTDPGVLGTSSVPVVSSGSSSGGSVVVSKPKGRASTPVVVGSYCDVPGTVAGQPVVVASTPKRSTAPVVTRALPPSSPVIIGEAARGSDMDGWRRRSVEGMSATRVSGSLPDDELAR